MWVPYKRRDAGSLTYVSIYNSSNIMAADMWGRGLPTPGSLAFHLNQFLKLGCFLPLPHIDL
jgi:hypothetical protein